jgi:hypothetical protein
MDPIVFPADFIIQLWAFVVGLTVGIALNFAK